MRKVIKNLKSNKDPGSDGVTNCIIKQQPCHFVIHLVAIYNSAQELQHFPTCWKKAEVVTIPKQGKDPKFPQNRRPISLLSCLCSENERVSIDALLYTSTAKNKGLVGNIPWGAVRFYEA